MFKAIQTWLGFKEEPQQLPYLPSEILEHIFKYLKIEDMLTCARVCQEWRDIIDRFNDNFWERYCRKDYKMVETSYKRSGLTWLDFWDSLYLWREVSSADIQSNALPYSNIDMFNILANSIISFPRSADRSETYQSIVYYDLKTMTEIKREITEIEFVLHEETDDIILLKHFSNGEYMFRIIPKVDRKNFLDVKYCHHLGWFLKENDIFFDAEGSEGGLTRIRVIINGVTVKYERKVIVAEAHGGFGGDILDIRYSSRKRDRLNILSSYYPGDMAVALVRNGWIGAYRCELTDQNGMDVLNALQRFGFDWASPATFKALNCIYRYHRRLAIPHTVAPLVYYQYVITATRKHPLKINIYCCPYNKDLLVSLHESVPVRIIDLKVFGRETFRTKSGRYEYPPIERIEVVEMFKGHKLLIHFCSILHVIEMSHSDSMWRHSRVVDTVHYLYI